MHSIFSHNGATEADKMKSAARDRLSLHSALLPLPCTQFSSVIHLVHLIEKFVCFFSFSLSYIISQSFSSPHSSFTCPLIQSLCCLSLTLSPPRSLSPSFPFSRETLTTQSRFVSYSHKPLKASHFRIFHSRVAHQLCHSHRCGHTSQRADTHIPTHFRARTHFLLLLFFSFFFLLCM